MAKTASPLVYTVRQTVKDPVKGGLHSSEMQTRLLSSAVYHALYLEDLTAAELIRKMACVCSIPLGKINQVYRQGPTGIHILLSDQVQAHGL